jgi:hypothetical protein
MRNPFRYFNSLPEVIRLAVLMYVRYPLSLRQVEDLLFERGIDISHETVRFWWNGTVKLTRFRLNLLKWVIDDSRGIWANLATFRRMKFSPEICFDSALNGLVTTYALQIYGL